jgi:phosphate-selective porin
MQTQFRDFPKESGDTGTDSVFLRRVRPIFEGTVYKYFDFKIMPDFGQSQVRIFDAYLTQHASTYGVGINWYLNKNFKLQADWYHTNFDTPVKFGDKLRDFEDVLLTQFQIAY